MNRTTWEAGSTAYGVSDVLVTTTSPFSRCSASKRTASSAFESIFTTGNFSSRSFARTPSQYFPLRAPVIRFGVGVLSRLRADWLRSRPAADGRLAQHEVAQPQISDGNHRRDQGHYCPSFGEIPERHRAAGALGNPDHDDVRAGTHSGEVATEDGAQ